MKHQLVSLYIGELVDYERPRTYTVDGLTNVAMVRPELLNHARDQSVSVNAIYQHLTRCETLTPTLKHHFHGSAHARLHMFRSSRSG